MKNNPKQNKTYSHSPQKEKRSQEEKLTYSQILQLSAVENDFIHTPKIYIDIAGDLVAGIILSRIVYWFSPSKNGNPRAQVEFGGNLWLVKTNEEWWEECRISLKQIKLAKNKLKRLGLIIIETHLFQNKTASHIRLNSEKLEELYNREIQKMFTEGTKGTDPEVPKGPTYNNTLDNTLQNIEHSSSEVPTSNPKPEPPKQKEQATASPPPVSPEARRLTLLFIEGLKREHPNIKIGSITSWEKHVEKMLRVDNRIEKEIEEAISWLFYSTNDQAIFWRSNILSTCSFRKQYDRIRALKAKNFSNYRMKEKNSAIFSPRPTNPDGTFNPYG